MINGQAEYVCGSGDVSIAGNTFSACEHKIRVAMLSQDLKSFDQKFTRTEQGQTWDSEMIHIHEC